MPRKCTTSAAQSSAEVHARLLGCRFAGLLGCQVARLRGRFQGWLCPHRAACPTQPPRAGFTTLDSRPGSPSNPWHAHQAGIGSAKHSEAEESGRLSGQQSSQGWGMLPGKRSR